jgi:non-ribosomal peptide synthetase component F
LSAELKRQKVTTLFLTTAWFNQAVQEIPSIFARLKQVLFGGEMAAPRWVQTVLKEGKPERLLHVYGPTETTTFATWHDVSGLRDGAVSVPVGRPISNTEVYVLDRWQNPMPVGLRGELYIGGDGLARGYWKDSELTAARFVPHPFRAGERLYKTGDFGFYTAAERTIEFLGREDSQVKLRGFRVELEEIEAEVKAQAGVTDCVVTVREDEPGWKQLVCYVVWQAAENSNPRLLQNIWCHRRSWPCRGYP